MTEQADIAHLTLALLRQVDERTERMAEDLHDLKVRMSLVAANLASVNRRMDCFEERLAPIERRLESCPLSCAERALRARLRHPELWFDPA